MDPSKMAPFMSSGASAGIPGVATLAGLIMALAGKKQPGETIQMPQYDPQQQQYMGQAREMAMQGLKDPYAGFDPIADKARSDFQSETAPSIANRFGGLNATRSSGYNAAMSGSARKLEESLAAQRSQYGLQNRNSLMNLLGLGLRPQYDNIYKPESAGMMQSLGSQLFGAGIGSGMQSLSNMQQGASTDARQSRAIEAWQEYQKSRGK